MMLKNSLEYYVEMKLYNDVMGIALAVWGHSGDCPVFNIIDEALDHYNLEKLQHIHTAYVVLSNGERSCLMSDTKTENTMAVMEKLRENILIQPNIAEVKNA